MGAMNDMATCWERKRRRRVIPRERWMIENQGRMKPLIVRWRKRAKTRRASILGFGKYACYGKGFSGRLWRAAVKTAISTSLALHTIFVASVSACAISLHHATQLM